MPQRTSKEVAYLWLHDQTRPEKMETVGTKQDVERILGDSISDRQYQEVKQKIDEEVSRWRERFSEYLKRRNVIG